MWRRFFISSFDKLWLWEGLRSLSSEEQIILNHSCDWARRLLSTDVHPPWGSSGICLIFKLQHEPFILYWLVHSKWSKQKPADFQRGRKLNNHYWESFGPCILWHSFTQVHKTSTSRPFQRFQEDMSSRKESSSAGISAGNWLQGSWSLLCFAMISESLNAE